MAELLPTDLTAFEAENRALRAEVARLQHLEQQQAQAERVRLSQVRFRAVFEHSPLGHTIIGPDLLVCQANAAVANLLNLSSPQELVGHRVLEFACPEYVADWTRLQQNLWAHLLPWFSVDTCLMRADGSRLPCRVTSVLFPDGEQELCYTTLEDISIRHALEAQVHDAGEELHALNEELRVANEELSEANVRLGQVNTELDTFLYAASHDLRLPIANLQGLMQLLIEYLPADTKQQELIKPTIGMMQESMAHFRHTLDRLATFTTSRSAGGLPAERVELVTVLEQVRHEVAPLLAATDGQLLVDVTGTGTLWFTAQYVYSVLSNLVSNALKYRHPDRAPVVQVRSFREQGKLVVRVQDNGLGLSEQQQGQLFRLFKRLHSHIEGTGIGLYLVKKILDHAGGSIRVESEPGRGSTFIAVFPC